MTIGPAVPAVTALGAETRQALPPGLVEALDRVGDQVQIEVLDPLLCSEDLPQLTATFQRLFGKFRDYYISTVLIVWANLEADPQRFSALTLRTFQDYERLLNQHGPKWIGEDGTLNALQGLATITRVTKAGTRLLDRQPAITALPPAQPVTEECTKCLVAFAMAFSGVLSALAALAVGRISGVRLENAVALAHWSRTYAARAYHYAKEMHLLRPPEPRDFDGPGRCDTVEEDVALAEAGVSDYRRLLLEEEHAKSTCQSAARSGCRTSGNRAVMSRREAVRWLSSRRTRSAI